MANRSMPERRMEVWYLVPWNRTDFRPASWLPTAFNQARALPTLFDAAHRESSLSHAARWKPRTR